MGTLRLGEHGVLELLGDASLDHLLGRDLDGLPGCRVAARPRFAALQYELRDAGQRELAGILANVTVARSVGAHLSLAGVEVWFDEWKIRAGDSIPGRLNEGLQGFDAFVVLWSAQASRSVWVRQELNTAIVQALNDTTSRTRVIPCRLDATPLPPLIQDRKAVDFSERQRGIDTLLSELIGERSRRARLLALQRVLSDLDVTWHDNPESTRSFAVQSAGRRMISKVGTNMQTHTRDTTQDYAAASAVDLTAVRYSPAALACPRTR